PLPLIRSVVPGEYGSSMAVATLRELTPAPDVEFPNSWTLVVVTAKADPATSRANGTSTAAQAVVRSSARMIPLPLVSLDKSPLVVVGALLLLCISCRSQQAARDLEKIPRLPRGRHGRVLRIW